jgi:hypothetical protein
VLKPSRLYEEVNIDAPHLRWLLTLLLDSNIELSCGEVVAAMKHRVLAEPTLTPLAWRFIANGNSDHFRVVLDAHNPDGEPGWQWKLLVAWLDVLSGLYRAGWYQPLTGEIQALFLNGGLSVLPEADEIQFRGSWMRFATLRAILVEAEKRVSLGEYNLFIETDLPDVLTWLADADPEFDSNQYKAGWGVLVNRAATWRKEQRARSGGAVLRWYTPIVLMRLRNFEVECISDAFTLIRHALTRRLCADRFLGGCLNDQERILVVRDETGSIHATIRLSLSSSCWVLSDLRGFANADVSEEINRLGYQIARIYTSEWNKSGQDNENGFARLTID